MLLLPGQALDREGARGGLLFVFLCQEIHKIVISRTPYSVRACGQPFGSVGRSISSYVFGIFLAAQSSQCRAFLVVFGARRDEIISRQLPECYIEARAFVKVSIGSITRPQNTYPMTSYAFPGAIFFMSSKMADNSGSHGLCRLSVFQ